MPVTLETSAHYPWITLVIITMMINNDVITGGPDHGILRVSVRGRGSRHHPAATPPESPDHAAHRQDDRRRLKVCHHSILSTGDLFTM